MIFAGYMNHGIGKAEAVQQYQDRAHKRFLQALKTLAQIRKLSIPMIQVNVGAKQVNVQAGVGAPAALEGEGGEDG